MYIVQFILLNLSIIYLIYSKLPLNKKYCFLQGLNFHLFSILLSTFHVVFQCKVLP